MEVEGELIEVEGELIEVERELIELEVELFEEELVHNNNFDLALVLTVAEDIWDMILICYDLQLAPNC